MYNGKIEGVSFVTESGRKFTINVKFDVNVNKMRPMKLFLLFLFFRFFVIY
jgi:hypothetical protein